MERAKKVRDLRRNGGLMETETVRCIVCRTIYDTHTEFHAPVFPLSRAKRVRFPIFHPKPLTLQRNRWGLISRKFGKAESIAARVEIRKSARDASARNWQFYGGDRKSRPGKQ